MGLNTLLRQILPWIGGVSRHSLQMATPLLNRAVPIDTHLLAEHKRQGIHELGLTIR